jgi:hypothetical protein
MMGNEGGEARQAALKGKFGDIMAKLATEQELAQKYAGGISATMDTNAAAAASSIPGLRAAEDKAKRASEDAAIVKKNTADRAAYDAAWARDTEKFRRTRGNQIQRTYAPPESTMLPVYPAS